MIRNIQEPTITVTMSEVIRYSQTFTVTQLAEVLSVAADLDSVRAALDVNNSNYGTAEEDDPTLLEVMVPAVAPNTYMTGVEDREWHFRSDDKKWMTTEKESNA